MGEAGEASVAEGDASGSVAGATFVADAAGGEDKGAMVEGEHEAPVPARIRAITSGVFTADSVDRTGVPVST